MHIILFQAKLYRFDYSLYEGHNVEVWGTFYLLFHRIFCKIYSLKGNFLNFHLIDFLKINFINKESFLNVYNDFCGPSNRIIISISIKSCFIIFLKNYLIFKYKSSDISKFIRCFFWLGNMQEFAFIEGQKIYKFGKYIKVSIPAGKTSSPLLYMPFRRLLYTSSKIH